MLPRSGMRVVVGVSGGADSVALLHALKELDEFAPEIFVCHFNHNLRGSESERDAGFVSELCGRLGLPLEIRSCDTEEFSKRNGLSIEHGARELRYRFFREICEKTGAERIATAHTMDDRAETVLMRIVRGSGVSGISSINPRSGSLIRPFIAVRRRQIIEYLENKGEKWVEDSSNELTVFTRNRIRKQVLPVLETFNPQIKSALNRLADTAGSQSSYISLKAEKALGRIFFQDRSGDFIAGSVSACVNLHRAVRSELLRRLYAMIKGGIERLEFSHLEEMDLLLMSRKASGAVSLPFGITMEKSHGVFCLRSAGVPVEDYSMTVRGEESLSLPGGIVAHFEKTYDTSLWGRSHVGHFSLEKTEFPIEVRNFRPGDRTIPLGMDGTKKIKSIFSDRKIPSFLRKRLPIFVCGGEIIWTGGVAFSDLHKAVKGEKNLRITLEEPLAGILQNLRED